MKTSRRVIASGQALRLSQRPARQTFSSVRCLSACASPTPAPRRSTTTTLTSNTIAPRRNYASSSSAPPEQALKRTGLHDLHLQHRAKMVPFAGYSMPVQYADQSVSQSHIFTRTAASLFDVGHMVQWHFSGPDAASFLERITPSGVHALAPNKSTLSTLLHPGTGGIVDDCIITRIGEDLFYVVTNAACREKDSAFIAAELEAFGADKSVETLQLDGAGLVALQGPLSQEILSEVLVDQDEAGLAKLAFGSCILARIWLSEGKESTPLRISRGGYTGEDGFEISVLGGESETVAVVEALLKAGTPERLRLAGLGARDSLRLEAGMCLYGHDLDDTTTPVEAGLSWIIPPARREKGGFNGAETILPQLVLKSKGGKGVERRRIGLVVSGAPAREGAEIVNAEGEVIGAVTSGCPSPTMGKNIAMGYVKDGFHKAGTELGVLVRGKKRDAVATKMPFVPTKYFKPTIKG